MVKNSSSSGRGSLVGELRFHIVEQLGLDVTSKIQCSQINRNIFFKNFQMEHRNECKETNMKLYEVRQLENLVLLRART